MNRCEVLISRSLSADGIQVGGFQLVGSQITDRGSSLSHTDPSTSGSHGIITAVMYPEMEGHWSWCVGSSLPVFGSLASERIARPDGATGRSERRRCECVGGGSSDGWLNGIAYLLTRQWRLRPRVLASFIPSSNLRCSLHSRTGGLRPGVGGNRTCPPEPGWMFLPIRPVTRRIAG